MNESPDIIITIRSTPMIMARVMERWVRENSPTPFQHGAAEFHLVFTEGKTFRPIHLSAILAPAGNFKSSDIDTVPPVRFRVRTSDCMFKDTTGTPRAIVSLEEWRDMFMGSKVSIGNDNVIGEIVAVDAV